MKVRFLRLCVCLGTAVSLVNLHAFAQQTSSSISLNVADLVREETVASAELPDAPQPQGALQATGQDAANPAAGTPQADQEKSQQGLADEQLKKQTKQRVLGIVPNFNTSYIYNAAPLTAKQKFKLAFRSQTDPVAFGVTGFVALIEQAEGTHYGYGGGWGGYAKRYGQSYTDSFDGQMLGNALLPSVLHQDPRYFRLGRGPVKRRILYALGTNVIAHHDGTGRWEPNYSNVLGNFAAGGISNLYLPKDERGFSSTITGGLVVIAEGGAGSMFQEFWPDIARRFLHKDPTHGQDAVNASLPDPTGGRPLFHNPPKHPKTNDQ
jgi:hypothetical protein